MKTAFFIFVALLSLAVAWSLGYRTGSLDCSADAYAAGYDDAINGSRQ